ncbi:MAG: hypothetical protein AAF517_22710, partial [Planctomycetota bacterium]
MHVLLVRLRRFDGDASNQWIFRNGDHVMGTRRLLTSFDLSSPEEQNAAHRFARLAGYLNETLGARLVFDEFAPLEFR